MPGIKMLEPASGLDLFHCLNSSLKISSPTYIRMNKALTPYTLNPSKCNYRISDTFYNIYVSEKSARYADLTIVSSGMLMKEVVSAARELSRERNIDPVVINVLEPSSPKGISAFIVPEKPLFIYYNGNPLILSQPICRDLIKNEEGKNPSSIVEFGFKFGTTGSISDLLRHFELDKASIVENATKVVKSAREINRLRWESKSMIERKLVEIFISSLSCFLSLKE